MPAPHDEHTDHETRRTEVGPAGLRVPPGPLEDALEGLEDALVAVHDGRELLEQQRRAVGPALAATLAEVPPAERAALVHELYWHAQDVRVTDIAAGLGVGTARVAQVAGPLPVEVECRTCATPVVVERTSRSHRPSARCRGCVEADERFEVVDGAEIGARVGLRLDAADGCDGTLRHTQDVAFELGLAPERVLEWSRRSGGFCDCELLVNVLGRW